MYPSRVFGVEKCAASVLMVLLRLAKIGGDIDLLMGKISLQILKKIRYIILTHLGIFSAVDANRLFKRRGNHEIPS